MMVRCRIERAEFYEDGPLLWDLSTYHDGEWVSASCYETFAEAIEAFNERTRRAS